MNRSIQSRLVLALTGAAIALSVGMGLLLYRVIGREMVENFDRGLRSKGEALVSLVSLEPGGVLDFEFNEAAMPEYRPGKKAEYFQIWFADGKPYARSKSLAENELRLFSVGRETASFHDLALPDGRAGRAIRIAFVPQSEQPPPRPTEPMVAIIARPRAELNENLNHLIGSLLAATMLGAVVTALTSIWIVRRALRPLRQFAEQAAAIDATKLDSRISEPGLPLELKPIRQRLNDLLGRLEAAFARERRFTSDVAHELRTPIAELRSIVEIAMRWPDDADATRDALSESLAIAVQMQTLINTLLSLVRTNQNGIQIALRPIQLAPFVDETIARLRAVSPVREIELSIPQSATVNSEPALLGSVLNNLLLNASEYSVASQPIRCYASMKSDRIDLAIENQVNGLTKEDLAHIFDPFWRKDASRTGYAHAGLGLSLVRAYCGLMGIEVSASLENSNLKLCLRCPRAELAESEGGLEFSTIRVDSRPATQIAIEDAT